MYVHMGIFVWDVRTGHKYVAVRRILEVRCPATVTLNFISLSKGLLLDLEPGSQRHVQLILLLFCPTQSWDYQIICKHTCFFMGVRDSNRGPHAYTT